MSLINRDNIEKTNFSHRGVPFKWNDFHRALVIDAHDPRKLGRVKVRIPDLMPEDGSDYCGDWCKNGLWAHPANNYLGGRNTQDMVGPRCEFKEGCYQGACLIPPPGSWVFIFFENGEPNHPYYFGSLEAGQTMVLPENQMGANWEKKWTIIKTNQGRCIVISDDDEDARIELTGKKRMLKDPPNGDTDSVLPIDQNQTVIRLWEKPGDERLELHDWHGNYITMHIEDDSPDQLHIYFLSDIHIESKGSIFIKAAQKVQIDVGTDYACTAGGMIDTKCTTKHTESATDFERSSVRDSRTALGEMRDTTVGRMTHTGGCQMKCGSAGEMKMCSKSNEISGTEALVMSGGGTVQMQSQGPIDVSGTATVIQEGAVAATMTFPWMLSLLALSASAAKPTPGDDPPPAVPPAPDPMIPEGDLKPPEPKIVPPVIGDPYEITFGAVPYITGPPEETVPLPPVVNPPPSTPAAPKPKPVTRIVGSGHMFALHLKDTYREKIIPLTDKSYGSYTGFYLFRDILPSQIDEQFFDPDVVAVYDNYRNPTDWLIDEESKWWKNLDTFGRQAAQYGITIVPTLFDFCCSPYDPFVTNFSDPYTSIGWDDSIQGEYVKKVISHIRMSGSKYLINLGTKYYNNDPLPATGWFRKLIIFLLEECNVPSDKLALTIGPDVNLYEKNPYCRYAMWTGSTAPQDEAINNEEYVDGNWGGTGRVAVYNDKNELIDGYVKYIMDASSQGICCMNTWKMSEFISQLPDGMTIDHPNAMNYIFAPRQREAMRSILKPTKVVNDGFIDFT